MCHKMRVTITTARPLNTLFEQAQERIAKQFRKRLKQMSRDTLHEPPTLTKINTAILSDNSLSDEHKTALIELMRVAYETVTRLS